MNDLTSEEVWMDSEGNLYIGKRSKIVKAILIEPTWLGFPLITYEGLEEFGFENLGKL